jgi:beta-galactosidase
MTGSCPPGRTGYGDELGRARVETKPALLADAAAVSYQEFANVDELTVTSATDDLVLSPGARATGWVDGLITQGAKVLAEYDHPHFGRFPSVTTTEHGAGRITTVGTVPNRALGRDLLRWLVPDARAGWGDVPASVTVSSATTATGERLHVVHNWSWTPQVVTVTNPLRDLLDADAPASTEIRLGAWDVRVLGGAIG